jgi:hypothetical protein
MKANMEDTPYVIVKGVVTTWTFTFTYTVSEPIAAKLDKLSAAGKVQGQRDELLVGPSGVGAAGT